MEHIMSDLIYFLSHLEAIGFLFFLVGIATLVALGGWLILEGLNGESNDD